MLRYRGCTFKNLDNAQNNLERERRVKKRKVGKNRKKKVIGGRTEERTGGRGGKRGRVLSGHLFLR